MFRFGSVGWELPWEGEGTGLVFGNETQARVLVGVVMVLYIVTHSLIHSTTIHEYVRTSVVLQWLRIHLTMQAMPS